MPDQSLARLPLHYPIHDQVRRLVLLDVQHLALAGEAEVGDRDHDAGVARELEEAEAARTHGHLDGIADHDRETRVRPGAHGTHEDPAVAS